MQRFVQLRSSTNPDEQAHEDQLGNGRALSSLDLFGRSKTGRVCWALLIIAIVATTDWRAGAELPLGFLYLVPMAIVGTVLKPWQIVCVATICTYLTELFDEFAWNFRTGIPRDVLYFAAFCGAGILLYVVNRNRETMIRHVEEIETQSHARLEAEQQLAILIESSPAAIITTDQRGCILMANGAAHRMLGVPVPELLGRSIFRYLTAIKSVVSRAGDQQPFRAVMQSRGQREDGEAFAAEISFSTYRTNSGFRLALMIVDTSEEMRSREEFSLQQSLTNSRLAVGAISHEVRNICGAVGVVHHNLVHSGLLDGNSDFEALGNLVQALERLAALELRPYPEQAQEVDLESILSDLRIVLSPSLAEHEIALDWSVQQHLPCVWADGPNLMQVFLNLTNNSIRSLLHKPADRRLSLSVTSSNGRVRVAVMDNGGGVAHPDMLFRPFQPGAQNVGLGLYLARAFARSFGGELRYQPVPNGACFIVELAAAAPAEFNYERPDSYPSH